jgi:hypothetical protein
MPGRKLGAPETLEVTVEPYDATTPEP